MITLTEKRIQELEHHISVMKSRVEDYDKKINEIPVDPSRKDIDSLKNEFVKFKTDFTSSISRLEGDVRCSLQNYSMFQTTMTKHDNDLKDASDAILSLNKSRDSDQNTYVSMRSSLSGVEEKYSRDIIDIKNGMIEPKNDIKALKRSVDMILEKIDSIKVLQRESDGKNISETLNSSKDLSSKIQESERRSSNLVGDLERRLSLSQLKDAAIHENANITKEAIRDIKTDIATILTSISQNATQKPVNDSYGDKMKTMENSIAQIYSLLKKYETRD
jgi:hypothetical protein